MKLLFENKRYIVSTFLTILMVFCTYISSYANITPVFTDGDSTTRAIAENTAADRNIGTPIAATDQDGNTLSYTLGGTDAAAFGIIGTTGQLQTRAALNYEIKSSYALTVSVSDGNGGSASIDVAIRVTDVATERHYTQNDVIPLLPDGFWAADEASEGVTWKITERFGTIITYPAAGGWMRKGLYIYTCIDADGCRIEGRTIKTGKIEVTSFDGSPLPPLKNNANNAPIFSEGTGATRTVAENTVSGENIGAAVVATDADTGDVLSYSLGGTDAGSFRIVGTTGQLQTRAALDYETKNAYSVTVSVSDDNGGRASIDVAIRVRDVNETPSFATETATRTVAENTAADTNIGDPFQATDPDTGDTLTYSLHRGDSASFRIDPDTGQLRTKAALDFETKNVYNDLAIRATDSEGNFDAIFITINVTNVNEAPSFPAETATRSVAENTASGEAIGDPFQATDPDSGDTLTYSLHRGDAASFRIDASTGQLRTHAALDFEAKQVYNDLAIRATDSEGNFDAIFITINVTNVNENRAPVFSDGASTTRTIEENTVSGQNIGTAVAATDADSGDTLTYTLGGTDAASFRIVSTSGQLQTNAALDYETKSSYAVTVSVSDDNGGRASIDVSIRVTDVNENRAPVFADGDSTTRAIEENTVSGQSIGTAVAATDADSGDTLTYTLSGTDAAAFSLVRTSGQLQTNVALDYETKRSYSVTVTASDGNGGSTNIPVTIRVTDVNETPSFPTETATRTVAENTVSDTTIGEPFQATDPDSGDTLSYSLHRGDAAAFRIDSNTGQLRTHAALDFETKKVYNDLAIRATDSEGNFDAIFVTITVTNVNEAPTFTDGRSATRAIAENTAAGENIGAVIAATDPENDTLIYTLGGDDASSFRIISTTGQLQTRAALDYETKRAYSVTVTASDDNGGRASIDVSIRVTDVNENRAPVFTDGDSTTRTVAENMTSGQDIGTAVSATDADNDTLTYSLSGVDASSFSIVRTSGQLQTRAALDYETDASYSVTVSVSDGNGGSDSIDVTISVTDVNETPSFPTETATRTVAENTASGEAIGEPFEATDPDTGDTLTYSLHRGDRFSFRIDPDTGQLRTKSALDFETKKVYNDLAIRATDSEGNFDAIFVTITVTNVNEAPTFTDGRSATRAIAENTAPGTNIGAPVAATDVDSGDTLTYTLGGDDASAFSIVRTTGQLQTHVALDYETKNAYSVTVSASDDNGGRASIDVSIRVTNINDAPVFTDGLSTTLTVAEDAAIGTNIGTPFTATDADNDSLHYGFGHPTDGSVRNMFSMDSTTGQLQTKAHFDYETRRSYSLRVFVADGKVSDVLDVTITVTDVNEAPSFTEGSSTRRGIAEQTAPGTNIGAPVAARDVDSGDVLTYTLGGDDASAFSIVSTSGQLQTRAALDYETKNAYSVTVSVSDGNGGSDSITVTIRIRDVIDENRAPVFSDGASTRRVVAENTAPGTNIGTPIAATDADNDTLTYSLGGDDASAFSIVRTSGQLQTRAALDYETKRAYSVTVSVSDGNNKRDSITVTINITDVNEGAPSFTEGSSTTRTIKENTAPGTNIGTPVAATDVDIKDTLTYTLSGTDASSFSIVSTTGLLQTKAALDYETKRSYAVTISVFDSGGERDSITVTINITDVNENVAENSAPVFSDGTRTTRVVPENAAPNTNIGTVVAATDTDSGDTLTYTLSGTDASSFSIVSTSGQLQTRTALDYETKNSYSVTVSVSDGNGGSDSITVTIYVSDVNEWGFVPVQSRTPMVRDAIVRAVPGISRAEHVTAAHLARITELNIATTFGAQEVGAQGLGGVVFSPGQPTADGVPLQGGDFSGLTGVKRLWADNCYITDISALSSLTSLENLNLNANNITDISALSGLTNLKWLYLGNNSITDISALSGLTKLVHLWLLQNNITDISALSGLTSLAELFLYINNISDISPLSNLTKVTQLHLHNNNISDISPLSTMNHVKGIGLTFNKVTDISALSGMTQLTSISLNNNGITDDQMTHLSGLTNLEGLDLGNASVSLTLDHFTNQSAYKNWVGNYTKNSISDISVLSGLTKLTVLKLGGNPLTNGQMTHLSGLTKLTSLELEHTNISDISVLSNFTKLQWLRLQNNSITDISHLSGLTEMIRLRLDDNSITDVSHLSGMTKLRALYIAGNPISDYSTLRKLRVIDMYLNNNPPTFTDGASTTRSVAENTAANTNIGTPVAATDADTTDTLTYTLGGTDAASFSIVSTTGQLQTKAALDFETKNSYTVTVDVIDYVDYVPVANINSVHFRGGLDRITVTIRVTDVSGAAPSVELPSALPETTALLSNFPNPFNPETWIPYQLAKPADVTLTIYDIRGVVVRELKLGHQAAGMYHSRSRAIHWDGRNVFGEKVATGIYFYTLKAGNYAATRKLLIRK